MMDFVFCTVDGVLAIYTVIGNLLGADWNFYDQKRSGVNYNLGFILGAGAHFPCLGRHK